MRASADGAVDLMTAKPSEAARLSRGEARLRRRAERAPLTASRLRNTGRHEVDGAGGRAE